VKKSRAYRATQVKKVCLVRVTKNREGQRVHVGLDIGKEEVFAMLRWGESDFERPWKVKNPLEVSDLVEQLSKLAQGRETIIALEPTGTYGDPLRQGCSDAGLTVHRVSPKASHDYAEIFDGVPSKHDGKDAAIVAELAALGKSSPWPFEVRAWDRELAYWVDWMNVQRRSLTMWYGRLEGLLARHWPEATRTLPLTSGVLLQCLATYGSPANLATDGAALSCLRRWGRGHLSTEKGEQLQAGARCSVGVRQSEMDVCRIKQYASEALTCRREIASSKKQLKLLAKDHEVISSQAIAVGVVTACVLWVHLGDPRSYGSGAAYRKAMGLNLKEHSSGKWVGRLKISKRGHSEVRRWMYFAVLRLIRQPGVKEWYEAKKAKRADDRTEVMRALVGVMRKLALALHRVGTSGEVFDASLLFPGSVQSLNSKTHESYAKIAIESRCKPAGKAAYETIV
jgi:transposase